MKMCKCKIYRGRRYEFYIDIDAIKSNQCIKLENVAQKHLLKIPYEFYLIIKI